MTTPESSDPGIDQLLQMAKETGFDEAGPLDPTLLKAREDVRGMCAQDKCHAYNANWTCPPECGTIEECQERMNSYSHGLILQTVAQLQKSIDTKGYARATEQHIEHLYTFATKLREYYPDALVLGAGPCQICKTCAYPEPCRFPQKACSSMEAYGLFVTQVCRDNHMKYYYGPKTLAYTGCVLF